MDACVICLRLGWIGTMAGHMDDRLICSECIDIVEETASLLGIIEGPSHPIIRFDRTPRVIQYVKRPQIYPDNNKRDRKRLCI